MKNIVKPQTDEREPMIVLGILTLYFLIVGFVFYLYFLHRISFPVAGMINFVFTLVYLPRFLLINKLKNKDEIQVLENYIMINGKCVKFSDILDFRIEELKPVVVFFFNNKMIILQESIFYLRTQNGEIHFNVFGTEKMTLLKEYLCEIINPTSCW